MKKIFLLFTLFTLVFSACKKSSNTATVDPAVQAKIDDDKIQAYLKLHPEITTTKDASGLYYQILAPGTGTAPTTSSTIRVAYIGKLLDGTQFDSSTNFSSKLSVLIKGWQIGIPFIKAPEGRILLIIPSALGYGTSAAGSIPANSVLVFTIDLFAVQG